MSEEEESVNKAMRGLRELAGDIRLCNVTPAD